MPPGSHGKLRHAQERSGGARQNSGEGSEISIKTQFCIYGSIYRPKMIAVRRQAAVVDHANSHVGWAKAPEDLTHFRRRSRYGATSQDASARLMEGWRRVRGWFSDGGRLPAGDTADYQSALLGGSGRFPEICLTPAGCFFASAFASVRADKLAMADRANSGNWRKSNVWS